MTTQKHLIKRLVLELTVADSGEAYQLQEEVSRICRRRLVPIIDEHCSALSAPDRIDRIDSLEVDLGTLDLANLEADLVARFTRQLPRALFERIGQAERQVKDREVTPRSASQLELLALFARTGRLPWWADPSRRRLLNDALEYLIPEAPTRLSPLMRELVREPESLRRIILHADDRILAALFGLLAPAFDRAVPDFPEQLSRALRAAHLLAGRRPDQLRTALWQALLSTAGAGERSRQGPQIFYRDVLVHAAGRLGVDFESLLSALREALGDPSKGREDRAGTLATILEALPPADDIDRIDSLEVDLGTLDLANLEADLVARFTRQLPRALHERIGQAERQVQDDEVTPRSVSQLELLALFARTGRLPWWADPSQRRLLNDALEYLILEAPTRLSPLMRELVREPESLRRMILHADDRILAALFGLLAPAFDRAVPDFPEQLSRALRAAHLLAGRRPDQLRTALWQALLSTAGAGERSRQGPQIFYRDVLVHAAGRLGVDFESLLSALREALGDPSKGREDRAGTLATILEALPPADDIDRIDSLEVDLGTLDLANLEADLVARFTRQLPRALHERIGQAERQVQDDEVTPRSVSQLELLALFARTGRLPWWADPSQRRLLNDALEYLILEAPTRLSPLMRELVREPESLRRIILHADDRILAALFGLLAPAFDRAVPDFPEQLSRALRAAHLLAGRRPDQLRTALWQALLSTAGAGERSRQGPQIFYRDVLVHAAGRLGVDFESLLSALREALGDPSKGREDRAGTLATILEALPPADDRPLGTGSGRTEALPTAVRDARKREPLREAAPVDQRFSDSDEVHLPNAGLVLLWPFLGHFFEQLGLMEGKQFKDAAAVHRAVGLLGYLATEDPAPEEYQLPLCKVLCGMELDEVFDFGPPVTEAEAEECSNLLTAVIGHAPILKNMSIAGFRGTFLIRHGLLGTRDGSWLLRVEGQTYDIVLERFPWTWAWVKLPWMEAPLRAEW